MDRNSDAYRAAVRAAVDGAPPVGGAAHAELRGIFAATSARYVGLTAVAS